MQREQQAGAAIEAEVVVLGAAHVVEDVAGTRTTIRIAGCRAGLTVIFVICNIFLTYELRNCQLPITGDQLLAALAALANPHRLRIIAALTSGGRNYVSQLAREVGISRPLLHLHLQRLEDVGLVTSKLELSRDGKALNYFEVADFDFELTPSAIVEAAKSLTASSAKSDQ